MVNALLEAEDLNVFAVDWREGARTSYLQTKRNCRTVGKIVGEFVRHLGQPANMVHIIGHSIGAHAAGFAGKATQSTGLKLARISGLDPAGPGFRRACAADRLDRSDAMFVDVIHTDTLFLGNQKPVGHVDFYPNKGWHQPGCILKFGCSHFRAYKFYTESVSSRCQFPAYRCPNWDTFSRNRGQCDLCGHARLSNGACSVMGYPSINYPDSQGSMYLKTIMDPTTHCRTRARRATESSESNIEQCVQSLGVDMRQEILEFVDFITGLQETGMEEDFCSMYSDMETVVVNIAASNPNCGPEDIPVILEYIGDGKYDAVIAWAEEKCPLSTSDDDFTLSSS
ncbi:pancreatic triacylglycerol lipase-like [Branchiostoma lanceolatum]|uniref:pancreatic triacylglycerol lipase-like n=1 Tax=Branchiostoma lanceolatum TaxID=7740 RepID=UPI003453240D